MWDVETLRCLRTLEGHEDNVRVLAVGERYMFSGSWDKTIRVWVRAWGRPYVHACMGVAQQRCEAMDVWAGADGWAGGCRLMGSGRDWGAQRAA